MAYCASCGQALQDGARFCAQCGATVSGQSAPVAHVAPAQPVTRIVVVEAKRGGRLAFKGFLLAVILAVIFSAANTATKDKSTQQVGMIISFGLGAAYIIMNLRKWKRNNDVVHGAGIGWAVAVLFLLMCVTSLANFGKSRTSPSAGSSDSSTFTPSVDPKDVLMRDVHLDYTWRKEGLDDIMIADFTLKNPTQYRFKDVEVKCTHFAPSGTEIDSNTRTIYEIVEPNSTKVLKNMNMGFIHTQATSSSCAVNDLTVLP